jgi:hypothetical protein
MLAIVKKSVWMYSMALLCTLYDTLPKGSVSLIPARYKLLLMFCVVALVTAHMQVILPNTVSLAGVDHCTSECVVNKLKVKSELPNAVSLEYCRSLHP